jgi:hypothetical protein
VVAHGDVVGCLICFETDPAVLADAEDNTDQGISAGPRDGERLLRAEAMARAAPSELRQADMVRVLLESKACPQVPPWAGYILPSEQQRRRRRHEQMQAPRQEDSHAPADPAAVPPSTQGAGVASSGATGEANDHHIGPGSEATSSIIGSVPAVPPAPPSGKTTVNHRLWGSSIRFFLNGEDLGTAFIHLTKEITAPATNTAVGGSGSGGESEISSGNAPSTERFEKYFPAASCFGGASVRFNPGPSFTFPPPASAIPSRAAVAASQSALPVSVDAGSGDACSVQAPQPLFYRPISDLDAEAPDESDMVSDAYGLESIVFGLGFTGAATAALGFAPSARVGTGAAGGASSNARPH